MKIIGTDNLCEMIPRDDILVCENIEPYYQELILSVLNGLSGEEGLYIFKVVEDDYKLYSFEE